MSRKRENLERTGQFTRNERSTYFLQYRFDLGNVYAFADIEAIRGNGGYYVTVSKDGSSRWGGYCTPTELKTIEPMYLDGAFKLGEFIEVFEYERDYE